VGDAAGVCVIAMPQRYLNPYHNPNDITPALSNLAKAFFSGPSRYEIDALRARQDAHGATALKSRAEQAALERTAGAQQGIADIFAQLPAAAAQARAPVIDPGVAGPARGVAASGAEDVRDMARMFVDTAPSRMASMAAAGGVKPEVPADLFRFYQANSGADTDSLARAMLGAGGGETQVKGAMSLALGPEDQRIHLLGQPGHGLNETQAKAAEFQGLDPRLRAVAVGPTETQAKGTFAVENFGDMSAMPDAERRYMGADAGSSSATPRNYVTVDGQRGMTLDGLTDSATGEKIPPQSQVYTNVANKTPQSVRSGLLNAKIARKRFGSLMKFTRDAAADPLNFGVPGFVKGVLQDTNALLDGVSTAMGYPDTSKAVNAARRHVLTEQINPELLPGIFDPALPALQTSADLLVYAAASAFAGQDGRALSDTDVENFKGLVGDPQSLLMNQAKFLAKLDTLDSILSGLSEADTGKTAPQEGSRSQGNGAKFLGYE